MAPAAMDGTFFFFDPTKEGVKQASTQSSAFLAREARRGSPRVQDIITLCRCNVTSWRGITQPRWRDLFCDSTQPSVIAR